ncbi:MAG: DUF6538 domain-containing protein [Desulfuromonadales bacterium]
MATTTFKTSTKHLGTSTKPAQTHLVIRNSIYYYRFTVPSDLQRHYKKTSGYVFW